MTLALLTTVLLLPSFSLGEGLQGRCDWGSPVVGSILGHNLAFYGKKTLAECQALCDANADCKSIDFSADQCYLGSCRIGTKCDNNFDATFKNYACGRDPVWLPLKGKEAAQISEAHGGRASRAIDGNSNSRWHGGSCTHTHRNDNAWWQVDMGEPVNVTDIKVTNRGDCCGQHMNGFMVKVDGKTCASNVPIAQGQTKQVSCAGRGQVIRVEMPRKEYLMICEFAVGVDPLFATTMTTTAPRVWLNLKGKDAEQSSEAHGGRASRAIDGNSNSRWHGGSCTHTHRNNPAWWQVDLGEKVEVTDIKVTNRGDCCGHHMNGFTVKLDGKPCKTGVSISQGQTKKVQCIGTGQVVRVELPRNDYLMICDFGVGVDPKFASTMTTTAPPVWLNMEDKKATQSTVAHGGGASRAIDGNSNSRWHGGSCTHTHRRNPAWWQVDLGEKVNITKVKLTNRGDCCGDQMSPFNLQVDGKPCATGVKIGQGQTKEVGCVASGQVVKMEVLKNTHLMLCEFTVGTSKEFASTMTTTPHPRWLDLKGKTATQSSEAHRGKASRAIDGNKQSRWHSGSCTHTHRNNPAWWQVDLGSTTNVSEVKVTNRGDCCGGSMNGFNVKLDDKECATNVQIAQGETKRIPCQGMGKIARLEVPKNTHLMLCEFGVGVATTTPPPTTSGPPTTTTITTTTVTTTTTTTTTVTITSTASVAQPSLACTTSSGICEKGKWDYFFTNVTEAQCKKICDEGRALVPEYGVQEYQYYFRQNGHYHDVTKKKPTKTRIVPNIFYGNTGGTFDGWTQRDHFYGRWTGLIEIKQPGKYTFTTASDDGSFLDIHGKRVVDNPGWHGWREKHGDVVLEPGRHPFVVEMFEGGGGAGIGLYYKGPDTGDAKIVVPPSVFSVPGGKYVSKWKDGMCAAYSHEGDACIIYTKCESVSDAADDICGSKADWLDTSFKDYKTCVYPKFIQK